MCFAVQPNYAVTSLVYRIDMVSVSAPPPNENGRFDDPITIHVEAKAVPLPAGFPLFASAFGLIAIASRQTCREVGIYDPESRRSTCELWGRIAKRIWLSSTELHLVGATPRQSYPIKP